MFRRCNLSMHLMNLRLLGHDAGHDLCGFRGGSVVQVLDIVLWLPAQLPGSTALDVAPVVQVQVPYPRTRRPENRTRERSLSHLIALAI